jgi:hypothetical protein
MIIVTLTYVTLLMRADNDGGGSIMALITLLWRYGGARGPRTAMTLAALGLFGAAPFFGESMITPAISPGSDRNSLNRVDAEEDEVHGANNRGDDPQGELARRESRLAKIRKAKADLEKEASDQAIRQVQEHLRVAADHRRPARAGLAGEQEHRRPADGRAGFGGSAHAQAARYDSTRHIGAQGA